MSGVPDMMNYTLTVVCLLCSLSKTRNSSRGSRVVKNQGGNKGVKSDPSALCDWGRLKKC